MGASSSARVLERGGGGVFVMGIAGRKKEEEDEEEEVLGMEDKAWVTQAVADWRPLVSSPPLLPSKQQKGQRDELTLTPLPSFT